MLFRRESVCTTRLNLFFHDVPLGSATGFFYRFDQDVGLVTNWHVFSGRNAITGVYSDRRRYVPNRVEFNLNIFEPDKRTLSFRSQACALVRDGAPTWWQHQLWRRPDGTECIVDIAVLNLANVVEDFVEIADGISALSAHMIVQIAEREEDWRTQHGTPRVASEVFVLGYPAGFGKKGIFPIWKRASIASKPLFPNDKGEPVFLVDALTRSGMSGSPVLYFDGDLTNEEGLLVRDDDRSEEPWLVGVYAGRDGATGEEIDMALGRVWKREVLDQIFFQQCPGGGFPVAA
jgi:hypothetical protein